MGTAKKAKRIEFTYKLAQRSARDQLISDRKNSARGTLLLWQVIVAPLGPITGGIRATIYQFTCIKIKDLSNPTQILYVESST